MRSRGRLSRDPHFWPFWNFYYFFFFFQSECLCCTHNILSRKRVGRNTYILQCSLSPRWAAPCCVCRRCGQALPSRSFGWAESRRSGGGCGCVCALIVVKGGCPYTPFFSLSLSPTQYTYRHTEHTVSDLQCMSKVCCAFYFPPFSVYRRSQAKMRERL